MIADWSPWYDVAIVLVAFGVFAIVALIVDHCRNRR